MISATSHILSEFAKKIRRKRHWKSKQRLEIQK